MAYSRPYCKCSAEASALVQHDSSSDEEICRSQVGDDTLSDAPSVVLFIAMSVVVSWLTMRQSVDYTASCYSDKESDLDSFDDFENIDVDNDASSSALFFREELASWATKHHCRRGPINELLQI